MGAGMGGDERGWSMKGRELAGGGQCWAGGGSEHRVWESANHGANLKVNLRVNLRVWGNLEGKQF